MIALPLVALAVLVLVGLGPASIFARRLPRAAQVALAAPLSAAVLACGSSLVYLGVSTKLLWAVILASLGACTIVSAKQVPRQLTDFKGPALVALVAMTLASIPFFNVGDWGVATFSNADPYVWVSQAKSLLEGAPGNDTALHPDRIAYERITDEHWPTGLPFTLAGMALLANADPVEVYGAFASLLAGLLALAVFACARGVLLWRPLLATTAAVVVGANGYLLFGTFFGWQAQIALATFGLLSVLCFRLALDRRALRRERVLAGMFAASGLATYGWTYVSFAGLLAATLVGYLVAHGIGEWRRAASVVAGSIAALAGFGAVPLVQLVRSLGIRPRGRTPELLQRWSFYDSALPSDALGFIPRTPAVRQGTPDLRLVVIAIAAIAAIALVAGGAARLSSAKTPRGALTVIVAVVLVELAIFRARYVSSSEWASMAALVTAGLLAIGIAGTRSFRAARGDVLVASAVFLLAELLFFEVFDQTPLYSIRLMGYGAPIFALVVLSTLTSRIRRTTGPTVGRAILLATGAALLVLGSITAGRQGAGTLRTTDAAAEIAELTVATTGPDARIEIDVEETWDQVWLAYYLRDRSVMLAQPSVYFTGFTTGATRELPKSDDADYRVSDTPGLAVAAAAGFYLDRLDAPARP